ncbi:MAG: hypothetical protein IPO09_18895 [Anaeromyxobacter sp.]|nr:hypothetical protein [Anaeromyxobacter sp.]
MQRPQSVHLGQSPLPADDRAASGRLVHAFGEACYLIEDAQTLPPFLTSLVSDSDLWLFVASNGGLTAGRRSPATALFPYVTEDKLADSPGVSGPITALVATRDGRRALWRPLSDDDRLVYRTRRRLYKNVLGTRLVFEEENEDLGLRFRAAWRSSARFGFLRECDLGNTGPGPVTVHLLDGLLDLLPGDADENLQRGFSVLIDAYKQAERLPGSSLAVYTLAAQVVDRPEPKEALHATSVWSHGLPGAQVHLTADALPAFTRGRLGPAADAARGQRGAYLLEAEVTLAAGAEQAWLLAADVARTQREVAALRLQLEQPAALAAEAVADSVRGAARIEQLLADTDAQQLGADRLAAAHHLSNVLFNDLRGGVYAHGTGIPGPDFEAFVAGANRPVAARHAAFLAALPALEPREAHRARVDGQGDPDLTRLSQEYLPLWFSRRHGDPSRPWNRFDLRVQDRLGAPVLDYQGNWRDIFQNWEALSRSFPGFAGQILAKFVNASTVDGYNPYRIGRSGIDWEVPEPDHPWSTIGYWGDHQIVYLTRLLELSLAHQPTTLPAWLERPLFTYADVPYELRPYADMVADPRNTIRFDAAKDARLQAGVREVGSDARLLRSAAGLVRVTLAEKLLVPALAKLASFVPGGGIWMNTQRPEWNDANNALVGAGVSMVTLCHLERYLEVLTGLLAPLAGRATPLSPEVAGWAMKTLSALRSFEPGLGGGAFDDAGRGALMDALGVAAGDYRAAVYRRGLSPPAPAPVDRLLELASLGRTFLRHTIAGARRPDGLFHAYNVLVPRGPGRGFGLQHLAEMLEGQVAALTTRAVDDEVACGVLDALRQSALYRADQRSYLLYPDRRLPGFLEKNVVPEEALEAAPLLARLLAAGDERIVLRDAAGRLRFAAGLHNGEACAAALAGLSAEGAPGLDQAAAEAVLEVYEGVFHHRAFTGRSGSMFAYEGLGSIYWHMVGKLVLAVQERYVEAAERGAPAALLARLADHYQAMHAGMGGAEKSPAAWGAFPLDAYSHTPGHGGARQPGMTGQVKEEILIRLGELGVLVQGGRVAFRPRLLRRAELLAEPAVFEPLAADGRRDRLALEPGSLAFTLCQVPVVYHLGAEPRLAVTGADGAVRELPGDQLDEATSAAVFQRTGAVRRIDVWTTPGR